MKKIKNLKIFRSVTLTHVCAVITAVFGIFLLVFLSIDQLFHNIFVLIQFSRLIFLIHELKYKKIMKGSFL